MDKLQNIYERIQTYQIRSTESKTDLLNILQISADLIDEVRNIQAWIDADEDRDAVKATQQFYKEAKAVELNTKKL